MTISISLRRNCAIQYFLIAILSLSAVSTTRICGQDSIDSVRQYPTEMLGQGPVEQALRQMKWLLARTDMTRQHLDEHKHSSQMEIENLFAQRSALVESLPLEFRFADDRARSEAVSKCLQELLSVRLDMATRNAMLEEESYQPGEIELMQSQLNVQKYKLQLQQKEAAVHQAREAFTYSLELLKKGMVPKEQVTNDELALKNAESVLETEKMNFELQKQLDGAAPFREVSEINREIRVLQAREEAAKSFLEQLNAAALTNQQIRRLDEEIDAKRREIELVQNRQFELQHEVDELETLKEHVEQDLKKFRAEEASRKDKESESKD